MELSTERTGVVLRSMSEADAGAFHQLLQNSATHLSRFPDYRESVEKDIGHWVDELSKSRPDLDFAIWEDGTLVGRIALNPVDPPKFGCGYLLAETACGRGLATLSLSALVTHAFNHLHATDVYAGVTHRNGASVAVLERVGFSRVASFEEYDRFHLASGL